MRRPILEVGDAHLVQNMCGSFSNVSFGETEVFRAVLDVFDYALGEQLVVGVLEDYADFLAQFLKRLRSGWFVEDFDFAIIWRQQTCD